MRNLAQIDNPFKSIPPLPTMEPGIIDINKPDLKLGDIVSGLLPFLFAAAGLLLLLYLIYGGLSLMLSRGDPKAVQSAKDKITSAVIGFIIVFVSYWLVQIVGKILGITAIQDIFK